MWEKWLLVQFRNPRHSNIYLRYLIPRRIIHFSGLRQSKDLLEYPDRFGGCRSIDTVSSDLGNSRISTGNHIQLLLHLQDFIAGRTNLKCVTRPGGRNAGDGFGGVDVHVVTVVVTEDFDRRVALIA